MTTNIYQIPGAWNINDGRETYTVADTVTGLYADWVADDLGAHGAGVPVWIDRLKGLELKPAAAHNQPAVVVTAGVFNNKKSVAFDSRNSPTTPPQGLQVTLPSALDTLTVMVVGRFAPGSPTDTRLLQFMDGPSNINVFKNLQNRPGGASSTAETFGMRWASGGGAKAIQPPGAASIDGVGRVFGMVYGVGSPPRVYQNSAVTASADVAASAPTNFMRVGVSDSTVNAIGLYGRIARIRVWNRALTDADAQAASRELATAYGL